MKKCHWRLRRQLVFSGTSKKSALPPSPPIKRSPAWPTQHPTIPDARFGQASLHESDHRLPHVGTDLQSFIPSRPDPSQRIVGLFEGSPGEPPKELPGSGPHASPGPAEPGPQPAGLGAAAASDPPGPNPGQQMMPDGGLGALPADAASQAVVVAASPDASAAADPPEVMAVSQDVLSGYVPWSRCRTQWFWPLHVWPIWTTNTRDTGVPRP